MNLITLFPAAYWSLIALLGLIVGSFLNVVILRLPEEQSIVFPASHCPKCKKNLRAYHNIPLLSYLFLKGKCAFCKKNIPIDYPAIEILTSILWLAVVHQHPHQLFLNLKELFFVSVLICVTFIDLKHRIIPDILSLGGMMIGLFLSFFDADLGYQNAFLGAFCGFGFFYGTAMLYFYLKKQEGLGGGDIKLLGMIGAFLGVKAVLTTILVGSTLGSIIGLGAAFFQKKPSDSVMQFAIPFGPFLVIGALFHLFFPQLLWHLYTIPI